MKVDIDLISMKTAFNVLYANHPSCGIYAHSNLYASDGKVEGIVVNIDIGIEEEESPRFYIYADGNFALDFLGNLKEWRYDEYNKMLYSDDQKRKLRDTYAVLEFIIGYHLINFGTPELKKKYNHIIDLGMENVSMAYPLEEGDWT